MDNIKSINCAIGIGQKWAIMEIRISDKIKVACQVSGIPMSAVADHLGVTKGAFSQRLKTDKFSTKELDDIAKFLGGKFEATFYIGEYKI